MMRGPQSYIDWQQRHGVVRELAERLCDLVLDVDHKRLCEGRQYQCTCEYDLNVFEAAKQLRNVIERRIPSALAAAARQGGDVQQAPGEAPQSGHDSGNAQKGSA